MIQPSPLSNSRIFHNVPLKNPVSFWYSLPISSYPCLFAGFIISFCWKLDILNANSRNQILPLSQCFLLMLVVTVCFLFCDFFWTNLKNLFFVMCGHWSLFVSLNCQLAFQVALVVKNPPANAGDVRDLGLIPSLGRSPGEGNGNLLQCSALENPIDKRSLVGYSL